jgi:hypothetical protein
VTNDSAALGILRADLDQLAHHLSRLDRGSRHQLARVVAEMLERVAAPQDTRR